MMPYATRPYDQNDQTRCQYQSGQSSGRRHHRRQQSSGSMTSAGRERGHHQSTRARNQLTEPSTHRHRHHSHSHTHRHHHHYQQQQQHRASNHQSHLHYSHRSPNRKRNLDRTELNKVSNQPEQIHPLLSYSLTEQGRPLGRSQSSHERDKNQSHRSLSRYRRPKSSDRVYRQPVRQRETMDDVDPRVMMMQWNAGILASNKRDRGIPTDTIDPTGRPFIPPAYFTGPVTDNQMKSFDAFHRSKLQSNPDFAIPKSSLDNLLGIDAMDMYSTANPSQGQLPFLAQRSMYSGSVRAEIDPSMRSPADRLGEFQHHCLRSLASMIVCPHTALPITVGLFTQSGSMRETSYLQLLGEEISHLNSTPSHQPLRNEGSRFSWGSSLLPLMATFLIAYVLGLTLGWQLGLAVAVTATVLYFIACTVVFFGVRGKNCPKSVQFAETLSRYIRGCQLVLNILFYRAPSAPSSAQPVKLLPISLNLTGCVSGMEAAAQMTEKLWQFAEHKYGRLAVRFQWASRDNFSHSPQTSRKYCCLPIWLWLLLAITSTLSLATLMVVRRQQAQEELIGVTVKPAVVASKEPSIATTTARGPDIHVVQEYLLNVAIVCAVLSAFSTLSLLAASAPPVVRLIQGRPFQRRKQSSPYGDMGKLSEPPADGCYGADPARCDPVSCMRFDNRENGRLDDLQQQQFPLHLTSAATVAATAAVAAVTAADRQWRLIEQEKVHSRRASRKLHRPNGIKSVRQLFSPSKAVLQATKDIESNSTEHSSQSRSSSNSDAGSGNHASSHSGSESDNELTGPDQPFYHDAVMFESGELLIRDQHRGKQQDSKRAQVNTPGKQNRRSSKAKSAEMQHLIKWKNVIRKGLMEACKVLSLIDSRMGDRQTRVVFCINATGGLPLSPASLIKLATFVRLIDRLAMQPPSGGTSNDVPVLFAPYKPNSEDNSKETKNLNPNASPTTWTPNIVVLLVSPVPHVLIGTGTQSAPHTTFPSQSGRDRSKTCAFLNPNFPWTNFKLWWSIHHVCHLPIYLEEEPSGHRIFEPVTAQSASGSPLVPQSFFPNPAGKGSMFDLFVGSHELSDLNAKRLRQLMTQISFMGRMINIERLQVEHQGLVRIDSGLWSGDALMGALVTWLCLLQHWPFHAAWLAVFIEQHLRGRDAGDLSGGPMSTPRRVAKSGSGNLITASEGDGIEQLTWSSTLSQLHARILKRLAPAVEVARMKAMSVSLGASQPGSEFNTRHMANYPPHVTSTLEICDLAMRDRDPRRLVEFLQSLNTDQTGVSDAFDLRGPFHSRVHSPFLAGLVTVRQLLRVMRLTPLMNPQINQWIRDVLSSKMLTTGAPPDTRSEQELERKMSARAASVGKQQQTASPRATRTSEEKSTRPTPTHSDSACRVKMKFGMPTKKLSQMTVEDICLLIRNISDLSVNQRGQKRTDRGLTKSKSTRESSKPGGLISSDESDSPINDPVPPAPINERRKLANTSNPYEDRIKQLNVTGTVLSICPLSDLQKELNMSFGDWQLFSSVVNYLKNKELGQLTPKSAGPSHTCGSRQSDQFRRSDPRLSRGASEQSGKWPHESHLISTVSDTSLALTVKSVPLTQPGRSPPQLRSISGVKNTKSMSALPSVSRTGTGLTYGQTTQRQQSALCPQHSRMAQNMAASNPTALLCPRHKEQVKSFLSGSQRELENAIDLTKRSQSDLRSRDSWDALVTQGQPKRQMYGAQTKPSASGYPVGLQRSPPTGASLTPRQQLKQAQFLDERSSTLPNSFRENLPPASANFVHAQYCAMHQKGKSPNWPLSSQPTWTTPGNPRDNAVASNHTTAESSIPLHRTSGESIPSNREANRLHTHRSLKLHSASAAKEHQVFDFSTPAREHLSHLDQMPSSSGQVARAEFCLPKDSESTSIAGELVEEVAEFSPALLEQDSSVSHDHVGRGEEKVESSDHQSSHSCDCNYWYSLEAAAAAAAVGVTAGATGSMKRLRDSRLTPSGIGYPGLDPDPDQSISDSLSTTRSQLDVSSGTSSDRSSTDASSNDEPDKLG